MKIIEKKTWPEYFRKVKARKKNVEFRLADFPISAGDSLILREWDPKTKQYTGRSLKRKVKMVHKVQMLKMHTPAELKKYGIYGIELK
ncbi:MAG: hypothetical protein A3C11_02795 [Candidatus Sungbacteria bacterium RIFCSPHIGHO2_02_FULL_49_12]|uniref:DUF3850 domain-containing protein n=1 Tax=Candidatus Sungbacteria bacterium RIFCSPHIGHO2_02_FULL_49_12 TaxID=1802271 RepID=A0A1G2KPX7_9BACT|nr:MAG: hypothetical protein A3C11_02795 [Candidatus Sungbacteria bacterium RIFCSPHIGHO2_02_FULL_49_12]